MKLLVMSDSHNNIRYMTEAVDSTNPDVILHLGDHISDARKLGGLYPEKKIHMVVGNCDYQADGDTELLLTLGGVKILVTHGHRYGVKTGLAAFIGRTRDLGADIALHGHTHRAMLRQEFGVWFMCPGQMERHEKRNAASYGIIRIEDGRIECGIEIVSREL